MQLSAVYCWKVTTVRAAWWATAALFLSHGLIVATWVSRIPAIQMMLGLNNGALGIALLGAAVGSICAIPATGWAVSRYGSKRIATWTTYAFCGTLMLPALASSALTLFLTLVAFGSAAAAMDVSMNAQAVEVEKGLGRPTMSRFHAMFSVGGMLGAAIGGLIAASHISPRFHFMEGAIVNAAVNYAVARFLLDSHGGEVRAAHRLPWNRIPPVLFALAAIGFCVLLSEGAMADWTAVYLRQVLHAGPATAACGYAAFSAAMALFRFVGDHVTSSLGSVRAVRTGSIVAGFGMTMALFAQSPSWALPGFALTGAGFSVIIPLVFGAGGKIPEIDPGAGIATVTGLGYLGFLVGPPVIGLASQAITLRFALGLIVILCATAAILAGSVRQGEHHVP